MVAQQVRTEFHPFRLKRSDAIAFAIFTLAFLALPWAQLDSLQFMPGDIGDSRLNNYFLEHLYQFSIGRADSLWHLPFYSPLPYVGGFSDNHFGTSVFYLAFRFIGMGPFEAFQFWFLFGYVLNFFATYYVLRRFGFGCLASSLGALIFAFALPTTAHAYHVQLHYRFAIPLSVFFFIEFCVLNNPKSLLVSTLWLLWQFLCGIYMGFFTLLFIVSAFVANVFIKKHLSQNQITTKIITTYWHSLTGAMLSHPIRATFFIFFIITAFFLLFYPYLMVTLMYGFGRSWHEISQMLPRPQSYFIADVSTIWGEISRSVSDLPLRHEHQMFPGLISILIGGLGIFLILRSRNSEVDLIIFGSGLMIVIATVSVFGFTLWYFFHWLPVVSAIRAMVRIDQALLFPLAYVTAVGSDYLIKRWHSAGRLSVFLLILLATYEFSAVNLPKSARAEWEARLTDLDKKLSAQPNHHAYLFVGKDPDELWFAHELDVMWVAQQRGVKTLNGYSGNLPRGFSIDYADACEELMNRVRAINEFNRNNYKNSVEIDRSDIFAYRLENCH